MSFSVHKRRDFYRNRGTTRSIRITLIANRIRTRLRSKIGSETTMRCLFRLNITRRSDWSCWAAAKSRHRSRSESRGSSKSIESNTHRTSLRGSSHGVSEGEEVHVANVLELFVISVPTQKMTRMLNTSAAACKKLMKKADLMGIDAVALEFQEAQVTKTILKNLLWNSKSSF